MRRSRPRSAPSTASSATTTSRFVPKKLGIYAAGATNAWFHYLFLLADPAHGQETYDDFVAMASMPRAGHAKFTQEQFDIVAEWLARDMPKLDELVPTQQQG